MERSRQFGTLHRRVAVVAIAALAAACSVSKQDAPPLAGPSGFADSLIMTAAPQILARDGSSMSTITVTARNADGSPASGRRLLFTASAGTLLTSEVLTSNEGRAAVVYVAPGLNEAVSAVTIEAIPVEGNDRAASHGTSVLLEVRGPEIPWPWFVYEPTDAAVQDLVTFDASSSRLGTTACADRCTYAWDFGDSSSGSGVGVSHTYTSAGVFNVKLTVTSVAGGTSASVTRAVRIAIPAAPQAVLTINPTSPLAGQTIIFSSSSNVPPGVTIVRHVWELDNGTPAVDTGTTSSYTLVGGYAAATTHQVTLTITDNYGRTVRSTPTTVAIP